jgi:uncharacterized SAM-binding protein YcdF (DUF218 family)
MTVFIYLYKVFSMLVLPMGLLMLLLVVVYGLVRKDIKKWHRYLLVVIIIIGFMSSTFLGEFIFVRPLEKRAVELVPEQVDMIIVLSGGAPLGVNGELALGQSTLQRLYKGFQLQQATHAPIIVTGQDFKAEIDQSMAASMSKTLIEWGVDPNKIIVEDQAVNTWQNATYSIEMMDKLNDVQVVAIVTSATHMARSIACFESVDSNQTYEFINVPCDFLYEPQHATSFLQWLPSADAMSNVQSAIHEYIGILWYKVIYTHS